MLWKYYIPHTFSHHQRTTWEDIYLRPSGAGGESLWITVDAGATDAHVVEAARQWEGRVVRGGKAESGRWIRTGSWEFLVTPDLDIWIREEDFNLEELLDLVRCFLAEFLGDRDPELEEAPFEEFEGSNQHARTLGELARMLEEEKKDRENAP